ncbi:MAG: hypothetical protein Q7S35_13360 [Candidatus Limnocylindrales bacterium]|nr:hypothetical protein [Candidatus Limnocylindrales bacterium]
MASYAASARLQGAVPRFAGANARPTTVRPAAEPLSASEPPYDADRIELVGRPLDERIEDWLASVGEAWSQLTFFVFDPESWR